MIIVNRKDDRMTGSVKGKPFNVPFDKENYQTLQILTKRLEACKNPKTYKGLIEEAQKLVGVNFKEEVAAANGFLKFRKNTGKYYLVVNKGKKNEMVTSIPLPEVLANRIVESYEENSDYMPLVLAWGRFLLREDYKSEDGNLFASYLTAIYVDQEVKAKFQEEEGANNDTAEVFATYPDIAITNYGLLATYKVVNKVTKKWVLEEDEQGKQRKVRKDMFPSVKTVDEVTGEVTKKKSSPEHLEEWLFTPAIHPFSDETKFYCGDKLGYQYVIGEEHVLPEEAPKNLFNTFGGGGLYVGGQRYIQGYSKPTTETLTCLVDPFDILSFQDDGMAFRTNRLFVNGAMMEGELRGMYFESEYAKKSDANIAEMMKEAIEKHTEAKKESDNAISEKEALLKSVSNNG